MKSKIEPLVRPMKRNSRPWIKDQLALLGTRPDGIHFPACGHAQWR